MPCIWKKPVMYDFIDDRLILYVYKKSKGYKCITWFGEDIKFYQSCAFYYKCTEALTLNETSDYLHPQPVMVHTFYH